MLQIVLSGRQRDVHDGGVRNDHQLREAQDGKRGPSICNARTAACHAAATNRAGAACPLKTPARLAHSGGSADRGLAADGSLFASGPLDGFLGDGGEDIDQVTVGIAERDGGELHGLVHPCVKS
jgi:hypothetical protein